MNTRVTYGHGQRPRTAGEEVVGLVTWAVEERLRSLQYGWNRVDAMMARSACDVLKSWLRTNRYPSRETLKAFWKNSRAEVALVMPGTLAGKARLKRLNDLIAGL